MANSIRQQLLCGDATQIHPMKNNLGLNSLQIDTELLNCHEDEDDNESEADHQHSQNDIHSDTDESNASDSDPIQRQVAMITIVVLLRKVMKILRNRWRTTVTVLVMISSRVVYNNSNLEVIIH
jgi:hypothetical protein